MKGHAMHSVEQKYQIARDMYAAIGVDTEQALDTLNQTPLSIQCWQLDDVHGFETSDAALSGGIAVTGSYPGRPETLEAFMRDAEKALALIPGSNKLNLHAIYLDTGGKQVDRDAIEPEHFEIWVDFARQHGVGLDFNPTCFAHPKSADGFTLSHQDPGIRAFWIEHVKRSRHIGDAFGKALGQRCVTNIWIPDGYKDNPIDTLSPRRRLKESLDAIFAEPVDPRCNADALESKLFGIGSESYTTGSHEFYTLYTALTNHAMLCLDAGHFHPTECISRKLSAYLAFGRELLLHVSRPVRWDSDHVVILDDETRAIMQEIVRADALGHVNLAMDFFDASIHRVAATVIGARSTKQALLTALLEPVADLRAIEAAGDYTRRLALTEAMKTMPMGLVWDYYCEREGIPAANWMENL